MTKKIRYKIFLRQTSDIKQIRIVITILTQLLIHSFARDNIVSPFEKAM